ncbi:MAG: cob(I)yrinic acid a,c-diamide adenosyltransferase [Clostridiales bacterium]|nr:cob(I)yrinic acid a,c-diamide adenosyltransferase [Candidatus Blautia equi]
MERKLTEVYCGSGRGKTAMALGQSVKAAAQGESVIIIQFLKGKERRELDVLEELDNLDIKIFRFDKHGECYCDLNDEQKEEENVNIMNAMNFAHKVVTTESCDFLVLDEILGLFDYGLVTVENVAEILERGKHMHIVMTGRKMPEELRPYVDCISTLTLEELTDRDSISITEE